jgi:glycosyltransferase involved in cell wall biosynthesis
MKVVINAASAKMGGAVTYIMPVLRSLPPPESGYEFDVLLPPETAEKMEGLPPNVRLTVTSAGRAAYWKRLWWEQVTLRRWLKKRKADALFATGNFGMFRCPVRQLLLVTNALYFSRIYRQELVARHSWRIRVPFELRRWLICRSVRQADVVMTPTRAMLDELRQFVEVESRKALVNYFGIDPLGPSSPEDDRGNRDLPPGNNSVVRLIYVSLYAEHKNLTTLLKTMPLLNKNRSGKFLLKTTADPAWDGAAWTLQREDDLAVACRPDVAPSVAFVGPLNMEQTHRLYKEGDIFVFPSLCESFGHPMVEAMAHGLPVVAADTPVNHEICGEAAVYFSPLNPEDLARQVAGVAADAALRERLATEGRRRAATRYRVSEHVQRVLTALVPEGIHQRHSCEFGSGLLNA